MSGTGTATLDFGASWVNDATLVITGQAGILATSYVEAWLVPKDLTGSANGHSVDEHVIAAATIALTVRDIVAGTGFTIAAVDLSPGGNYGKYNVAWVWV